MTMEEAQHSHKPSATIGISPGPGEKHNQGGHAQHPSLVERELPTIQTDAPQSRGRAEALPFTT